METLITGMMLIGGGAIALRMVGALLITDYFATKSALILAMTTRIDQGMMKGKPDGQD